MKLPMPTILLCLLAALASVSCSKGPGEPGPLAGGPEVQNQTSGGAEGAGETTSENPPSTADQGLAGRIRLPNMEDLPTDRELASKQKPDRNGSGVIARPPSE